MLRRLIQFLKSRVGRSLLIMAVVGFVWAAWGIWPERPLRILRFDRRGTFGEFVSIAPSGKTICIGGLVESEGRRFVSLRSGKEIAIPEASDGSTFHCDWQVAGHYDPKPNFYILPKSLRRFFGVHRPDERSFEIYDKHGINMSRLIYGYRWVGFSENNRGWTEDSWRESQIVLREWDVSYPRPPFLVWLMTGAAGGFVVAQWRRSKNR